VIRYAISPPLGNDALNGLFGPAWPDHHWTDFGPILSRSLAYVGAFADGELVGYVNLAWDGGIHAFLLDTTVHPRYRRRGIGRQLVGLALDEAAGQGITWVHVDFEPRLSPFYASCGFQPTAAGLWRCSQPPAAGQAAG
jgi:GNAT superfamily N-acetyltransferase